LQKRSKKLLSVGAWAAAGEIAPAPQAFQRWNACGAEDFARCWTPRAKHVVATPRRAAHEGKVFWFFFSKKNRFLPFFWRASMR
jgi:hypothetical protein